MPAESTFHDQILTDPAKRWTSYPEQMEVLKRKAKSLGLWNLFLSKVCTFSFCSDFQSLSIEVITDFNINSPFGTFFFFLNLQEHYPDVGVPLTNLEYAVMAEIMGRCPKIAPEACNCSAPDTGNMGTFPTN